MELMSSLVYRLAQDLNLRKFLPFYALDKLELMRNIVKDKPGESVGTEEGNHVHGCDDVYHVRKSFYHVKFF